MSRGQTGPELVTAAFALALAALVLAAAPARAQDATGSEVRALTAEAVEKLPQPSAALRRLRRLDRVDGRPVDLRAAIGNAKGDDLRARLQSLQLGSQAGTAPQSAGAAAVGAG